MIEDIATGLIKFLFWYSLLMSGLVLGASLVSYAVRRERG